MLGWVRQQGDKHLVFWLQCKQSGWDHYAGSGFVVEFQYSPSQQIGAYGADCVRARLPRFLDEVELERVRQTQNLVIDKLERPSSDYFVLQLGGEVAEWYMKQFEPVTGRYARSDDIWLRYHEETDVRMWANFLLEVLPKVMRSLTEGAT